MKKNLSYINKITMDSCKECGKRPEKSEDKTYVDLCEYNRMADGRAFTDYSGRCQKLTPMTSYDERMFLMNNAKNIMKSMSDRFICSTCAKKSKNATSTMLDEKYMQVCDQNSCKFVLANENGVGTGRK